LEESEKPRLCLSDDLVDGHRDDQV
jgi:hypothetical protein